MQCTGCDACKKLIASDDEGPVPPELTYRAQVAPNSPMLRFAGFAHLHMDNERAFFDNRFTEEAANDDPPTPSPGASISWRTDAERVIATLHYARMCDENCPTDQGKCYMRGDCRCACRVKLLVDGKEASWEQDGGHPKKGRILPGPLRIEVMYQQARVQHDYELILPWCAMGIDFRGLTLQSRGPGTHASPLPVPLPAKLRHIAFGDSITAGWCGDEASYPEYLAQWNGWEPVNVAVPGLALMYNTFRWLDPNAIGEGLARLRGATRGDALVTVMIGTNDCGSGEEKETGNQLTLILDALRKAHAHVPVAVITPIGGYCDDMERVRKSIAAAALSRHDPHLVLIDGLPLLPDVRCRLPPPACRPGGQSLPSPCAGRGESHARLKLRPMQGSGLAPYRIPCVRHYLSKISIL